MKPKTSFTLKINLKMLWGMYFSLSSNAVDNLKKKKN